MAAVKKFLDYEGLTQLVTKLNEKFAPVQALQFKGTVATISALPTVANVTAGSVYNVTTGGDTTADFVEGAGEKLQDGENVVAVNVGTDLTPQMKWDTLGGVFDITDRLQFGTTMPSTDLTNGRTFLYLGDTTYTYDAVTPVGTENPSEEGWYEYDGSAYILTDDTEVQSGITYYKKNEQYVTGTTYVYSTDTSSWIAKSAAGEQMVAITTAEIDALFA
jgi:hypothetical protein